jgi:hypothetical protein
MEQGGWLDQIILGILNFLNAPVVAVLVAVGGGFLVALLGRLSPTDDWSFIKEGPGRVLAVAFLLLAVVRSTPHLIVPHGQFECDSIPGPLGLPQTTGCEYVMEGTVHVAYDYTLDVMARDFAVSLVQDVVLGAVGAGLGIIVAAMIRRSRQRAA